MNIHHGKALWDNLDKMHAKQYFIGKYIQKRMKNNKLPYGMEYMNKLAKVEVAAEKAWKKQLKLQS